MHIWFALLAGITCGIAVTLAKGGGPLVGVNAGIGIFCFILAVVFGLRSKN